MDQVEQSPSSWFSKVKKADFNRVISRIQNEGALSLRDMRDKKLEDKDHPWASRKPSQRALQLGFHSGKLTVSERIGMLKKYELSSRHFDWNKRPKAASELEVLNYTLDRALRSQAVVSLDSICHLNTKIKPKINRLIESMVSSRELIELSISGIEATKFWIRPEIFAQKEHLDNSLIHILSPFDPLVIQRRRLKLFFDYEHRFEAYLPKEKRVFGYFGLPILFEDRIVAVIDLKTDRCRNKLDIQKWTWVGDSSLGRLKKNIEERLHYFELFQLS
jgi:uncharacterized protein YcaQ